MNPKKPLANQQGSMLLEGLIAILIFSMGILAIVGMQATSIKNVADAKYRVDASFLANQVIGQMWVDRTNLALYAYSGGTVPAKLTTWVAAVQNSLPGASTYPPVIQITGANNQVSVTISWKTPQETTVHNYVATAYINNG